jgi:predicted aspartyl protease
MPVASLPYRIVAGRPELLPLCDVYVLGPLGRQSVTCVIDTGAIYPVLQERVAEDVGLLLPKSPNFTLQYGRSVAFGRRIRAHIELEQQRLDTEIVFVDRLDLPYGILGRRSVFSRFNEVVFLEKVATPRVELRW